MESVIKVASYISERYLRQFGQYIDEMKLHKLLYLTQRECIIQTGKPIFTAAFHAWKYGPVIPIVRAKYRQDDLHNSLSASAIEEYKPVFDYIFIEYAGKRSFLLSNITHCEYSWIHAREGYGKYDDSDVLMSLDDIKKDASYIRERRKLLKMLSIGK